MRRHLSIALGVCLGVLMTLSVVTPVEAQDTKAKAKAAAPKQDRIDGTILSIDKATKTVTVRVRGKTSSRPVIYSDTTKFTFRNKPGSIDELKDGRRVICVGKYDDKIQLMATRIDVRDEK